jgi:hypothetical protein
MRKMDGRIEHLALDFWPREMRELRRAEWFCPPRGRCRASIDHRLFGDDCQLAHYQWSNRTRSGPGKIVMQFESFRALPVS